MSNDFKKVAVAKARYLGLLMAIRKIVEGVLGPTEAKPCERSGRPLDPIDRTWWDGGFRCVGYVPPPKKNFERWIKRVERMANATRSRRIELYATRDEYDQVQHAAKLKHLSMPEYIRRALNAQMRKEGVDAVLFVEREDGRSKSR